MRALDPGLRPAPLLAAALARLRPAQPRPAARASPPLLACGAELKNTFCLAKGRRAWVGHHIGDLKNFETLTSFRDGIEHFERLFAVEPEVVAHDLHPEYLSTTLRARARGRRARRRPAPPRAPRRLPRRARGRRPAVGAIYDGTGYGPDGTIWGGELLVGGLAGFERAGVLFPVRLPGGDAPSASRGGWRAPGWRAARGEDVPRIPPRCGEVEPRRWERDLPSSCAAASRRRSTTSVGRLFDAVAAICGVRARVNYEGQAAAELEAAADLGERGVVPDAAARGERRPSPAGVVLDARETVAAVAADVEAGADVATIAARFHNALAAATAEACAREAERRGSRCGGALRRRLPEPAAARADLRAAARGRARVLAPQRLPPNDGGISYGQAAVAAAAAARR